MIPRIIHCCWFGASQKPPSVRKCLASWQQHMANYQIIEWNETNFDIRCSSFAGEAYRAKKYAFVCDIARGYALLDHGGIYLDTDVEVRRSFDLMLQHRSFWGFEAGNFVATSTFGAVKGHELIKAYLDHYADKHFLRPDGTCDVTTNVSVVTQLLRERGLILDNSKQLIGDNNVVYPQGWFSPYDYRIGKMQNLSEAHAIHHYSISWSSPWERYKRVMKRCASRIPGGCELISLVQSCLGRR